MKLYEHQKNILEKNPSKHLLALDTGTGKTLTSLALADRNKCKSVIIVCPKALKEKWKRDIHESPYHNSNYLIISKEEFRRDWEKLEPYHDAIIVDEAHYFSGMTSQMSKSLRKFIKKNKLKYVWLLTATPYMSTPWNIYTLAGHLGYEWSYMSFKDKFFTYRYVGRREVPVVREGIEPEIARLVNKIGTTVRIDECADIPEQVFETEKFALTKDQKKWIGEMDFQEINPIVRFTKFHQIENGTLKGDGYTTDLAIESDKNDRIIDLCTENKKIAVICRYNLQIEILKNSTLAGLSKPVFVINGAVKNKDEIIQNIDKLDECVVLINAACSEGYELPSIGVCVFASLSFSYKDYKQMLGRFLRINRLKKNVYVHLVTVGSVDEAVYNAIMKKQDFDIEIFANQYRGERSGLSNEI